jgi:hypothetical protein
MVVRSLRYRFDNHQIVYRREKGATTIESEPPHLLKRSPGRPPLHKDPIKCYGFPESVRVAFQNAEPLFELAHELTELCQRIYYLGPLREYPQRQYLWSGAEPSDVGSRGENTIARFAGVAPAGAKEFPVRKSALKQ